MLKPVLIILIFALVAVGSYLTIASRRKIKDVCDFFLHGENLSWGYLSGSLIAANLSLGNLVFVCAIFGYSYGWSGVFWVSWTIIMLLVGFVCFGPRFKTYIESRGNFGTIHDFISNQHARDQSDTKSTKILTATMSCLSLAIAIIVESHLGTKILEPLLGISQPVLMCVFLAIVCIYCVGAGFYSVVFTDVMQTVFFAFATSCGIWLVASLPNQQTFLEAGYSHDIKGIFMGVGAPNAIGLTILGFFWLIATPDNWQRNCAARNINSTFKGSLLACVLLTGWVALFAITGMMVKVAVEPNVAQQLSANLSGGALPLNDIFLINFQELGQLYSVLAAIFAAGLLMAALSTADTFLIVIGHVMNTDLGLADRALKSFKNLEIADNQALLLRGKLLIMLTAFLVISGWVALISAGWLDQPIYVFFITYTIQFSLALPTIAGTFETLRSAATTNIVVAASGFATLGVGIIAMNHIDSKELWFGLPPESWMAMLPIFPVLIGLLGYATLFCYRVAKSGVAGPVSSNN